MTTDTEILRSLMEHMPDGFFIHDAGGRFLDTNTRLATDLGYGRDELLAMSVDAVFRGQWLDLEPGTETRIREAAQRRDGSSFAVEIGLTCRPVGDARYFLGLVRALRAAEAASEDALTGLANRPMLDEELAKACLHATRTGEPLALAMIDIDHFKLYNDGEGHVRGDAALKAVAGILQSVTRRPYDLAARYGGEEFLLLLPGVGEPAPILQRIAEELSALRIPHPLSPIAPHLTVSCGCVVAGELADVAPTELLAECDRALQLAKDGGRNRVEIARL